MVVTPTGTIARALVRVSAAIHEWRHSTFAKNPEDRTKDNQRNGPACEGSRGTTDLVHEVHLCPVDDGRL